MALKPARYYRQTRLGLLLLRFSGFSQKETSQLLGLTYKQADWHWEVVKQRFGIRDLWKINEFIRTTPQKLWPI